jgi:hypothetical protein
LTSAGAQTNWSSIGLDQSSIYTLPVIALLRKHLVAGLTAGALKG